jgi:hypothetical protein
MLEEISARTLREWMAYYALDPWGDERADLRSGIVAATLANIHRGKRAAFRPRDFMPRFEAPRRRQSVDEMKAIFRAAGEAAAIGIARRRA